MSEIKKVLVCGAGQMGSGIAQVCAQSKRDVLVFDSYAQAIQKSKGVISKSLQKLFEKKQISEDPKTVESRIRYIESLDSQVGPVDIAIEAVSESLPLKVELFKKLDSVLDKKTILASNTSSISITKLAAQVSYPSRFVGIHFMNPVPLMKLVELISGLQTDIEVLKTAENFAMSLGKTTIVSKDQSGFVVNRILMPMINEAVYALSEGLASAKDIDTGMTLGTNQPMGPLTLADFIGLDTCLSIMQVLHEGLGDSKYRPCPLLRQYVEAGWLGKKVGRGFYKYDN
jgi:3-hydroxybutyryl-CoA dehydrogenase